MSNYYEGFVSCGRVSLYYHSYGKGIPIIMLHGNMQSSKIFDKQVQFFSSKFRVITIDSRSHGKSGYDDKYLTVNVMADDCLHVMDKLKIQKAIFLGFSDGGNIALKIACKAPNRVISMVVIGVNIHAYGLKMFIRVPAVLAYRFVRLFSFIPPMAQLSQKIRLNAEDTGLIPEELQRVSVRTLILTGEWDIIKRSHTHEIIKLMPSARLVIIEKTGHNIFAKKSKQVNDIICKFITEKI